jgi:hypothetical protein
VIGRPATGGSAAIAARIRWATIMPAEPGDEHELVATDPPTVSTSRTDSANARRAAPPQHVVAGVAAALAVRRLEVVDVEDRERDSPPCLTEPARPRARGSPTVLSLVSIPDSFT